MYLFLLLTFKEMIYPCKITTKEITQRKTFYVTEINLKDNMPKAALIQVLKNLASMKVE